MRKKINIINSILLILIVACSSLTIAVAQEAAKEIRIKIEKDVNGTQQSIDKVFTDPNDPELKKLLEEHKMNLEDVDIDLDIDVEKDLDVEKKDESTTLKLKLKSDDEDQLNDFINKIEKLAEDMDIDFSDIDIKKDDANQMLKFFGDDFGDISEKLKNNSFKIDTFIDLDGDSFNFLSDDLKNKIKDFDFESIDPEGKIYNFFDIEEASPTNNAVMGVMIDNDEAGILITGLNEGFGAKKAGLQEGDLITAIDNKTMSSVEDVIEYIANLKSGDLVTVEYIRDNNTKAAKVELMEAKNIKKQQFFNEEFNTNTSKPIMGVMIKDDGDKVVINGITDNFGAAKAGLQEGDIIISVDDMEINSVEALTDYIGSLKVGDNIEVKYERAGKTKVTTVELMKSETDSELPQYFNWIEKFKDGDFDVDENFLKKDTRVMIMITDLEKEDEEKLEEISPNSKLKTDDLELAHFEFFPNPSEGLFNLSFDVEKPVDTEVNIYDLTGKIVYNKYLKNFNGEFNEAIDLQNNANGSYILEIIQGDKRNNKKIVVK